MTCKFVKHSILKKKKRTTAAKNQCHSLGVKWGRLGEKKGMEEVILDMDLER